MLSTLLKRQYNHLNVIELSASALLKNYENLQELQPQASICPVLKSNAYGHGLKIVSTLFDNLHAPFLVVDSMYEAYELYKCKVHTPILILGYTHPDNYKVKKLPFHFTVFDLETAHMLSKFQPNCSIHLFIDTGMHREGISIGELPRFIKDIRSLSLRIVGLTSHFADTDNKSSQEFTSEQIQKYKEALIILKKNGIDPEWRHISASGGVMKVKDDTFNMMRVGLASYGISPLHDTDKANRKIEFVPILTLKTHIAQVKTISKGDKVGYNGTYQAQSKMKIGVLPIGYYDGINRNLSNKGVVQVAGVYCPIIGTVSMNITTIDITHLSQVAVGDEVVVFSNRATDTNSIKNSAKMINMSPYELLVKISESTYRKVTK